MALAVRVLGAFEAVVRGGPVDLGGPRQRSVLARLAAAHGRLVPADRLVDELWPDGAPPRAAAGLQSFVSHLRRALEPDRPPRTPARVLVTVPPGYALHLPTSAVDAWSFDELVNRSGEADDPSQARELAEQALDLWRGPAYAEFADLPWAAAETARLDELHRLAVERRAEALLDLGAEAEAVPDLEAHLAANPLREDAWRLLALALYRAGRQGDALGALRRARNVLTDQLGVDPGPTLRPLEADILTQAPHLTAPHAPNPPRPNRPAPNAPSSHAPDRNVPRPDVPAHAPGSHAPGPDAPGSHVPGLDLPGSDGVGLVGEGVARVDTSAVAWGSVAWLDATRPGAMDVEARPARGRLRLVSGAEEAFVGRDEESARLVEAAARAEAGRFQVALVGGEAGIGKTALVERVARRLAADGWRVAWGRSEEGGGAPAAWSWAELLRILAAGQAPDASLAARLAPLLDEASAAGSETAMDAATGRFRLHLAVGDYLADLAARGPLMLVLDDLHWADEETLVLLSRLPERLRELPVLAVGTFRPAEADGMAGALARLARYEPVRLDLAGLADAEVAALVRASCAAEVGPSELAVIAERTGGNPFFARETARLLDAEGPDAAARGVPAGVGDVLRRRFARLPEPALTVLRHAAVAGPETDVRVLADLSGGDEDAVLDAVEAGLAAGLVTEPAPGRMRFAHALVRDTLSAELSATRRTRVHGRIAAALVRHAPGEVGAIAHHYLAAGTDPDRAVRFATLAASAAEARFAYASAAELWERAAAALATATGPTFATPSDAAGRDVRARERLELEIRGVRAAALAGAVVPSRARRARCVAEARALGDMELLARAITSYDVPTLWTPREYGSVDTDLLAAAREALDGLPDDADELRARLLTTLAIEQEGEFGDEGPRAAREALAIARRLSRPETLAAALNGCYLNGFRHAAGRDDRHAAATELLELATEHELGAYQVLAHLQLQQSHMAYLRQDEASRHRDEGQRLADLYGLPLLRRISGWHRALSHAFVAEYEEAERVYWEVGESISRTGIWASEQGVTFFGIFCLRLMRGRAAEMIDSARWMAERWPHINATADVLAVCLAEAGRMDEARRAVADAGPVRPDYFFELVTALRARRAILLGDRDLAVRCLDDLLPYADHIAGGASAVATLGPIAQTLGDLAAFLGRPDEAVGHYRHAAAIAGRMGVDHWSRAAADALRALGAPAA
ncbi:BTAD domain-containing putative transcriptional regulator [Actinomadura rupiterrae]|uniref:BTAD domain-containing putative transcriptional regulator n=1 Tax=Actinomadura rupiterrae TaxID=559627 RepID=UPI0020A533A7|nr:BTAD domain-containing putative transcriptional regulator [Actinomadura rupiterrae]MCP2338783.1 DNA-binding SARP family transcriptional activator [Actinomadura rupiterrae]